MKKIIMTLALFLMAATAQAATYYVRPDGGTAAQCTGLKDAKLSADKNCAFNHPNWALAPLGNPTKMVGGDTLIIDGINKSQYMVGFGAPNSTTCNANWPWDCNPRSVPSGPSAAQPTRILGKGFDTGCANPPQLWGTERVDRVLSLMGSSNVQVQCLEVTDHSDCQEFGPKPCNRDNAPYGAWASKGLVASDSANVLIKNVNIHGMAHHGVHAARLKDWTVEDSKIVANSFVGWDGDMGKETSSNAGTMTFTRVTIKHNGCGETYPGLKPFNCYSQDQGGYGDGIGTEKTAGNWVFNDVDISENVSDGLDLLYHTGVGTVTLNRGKYNNNAGNAIKTAASTTMTNVETGGRCDWFAQNPSLLWNPQGFNNCRAGGNNLTLFYSVPGQKNTITGGSIAGNGDTLIMTKGSACNGTETVTASGVTITPGTNFFKPGQKSTPFYNAGAGGNGDGPCGNIKFVTGTTPPPACVPDGSCSATVPACGTTTTGVDNCGKACSKVGAACPPAAECPAPTLQSVTVTIKSGDKTYTLTK